MALPGYIWFYDEQGQAMEGPVTIKGREGSAEVLSFNHAIEIPVDDHSGITMGTRRHHAAVITKQFCGLSPLLLEACCTGRSLQKAKLSWYQIDAEGKEQEYFQQTMEQVKVTRVHANVANVKLPTTDKLGHLEQVELRYGKVTWLYKQGNIQASDSWIER